MSSDLTLHKAVFAGDLQKVQNIIEKCDEKVLNGQDIHGNTALHIAVMKGNRQCVELLIKKGALPTVRNQLNWLSLHEAISYGDFDIIKILNDAIARNVVKYLKRDFICKFISDIKEDFALEFELRLKDYNPSTFCGHPEFTIGLTKKGLKIRADILLTDSFHLRPQRFCLIFDFEPNTDKFVTLTVSDLPFYQSVSFDEWEQTITDLFSRESTATEISELMLKENVSVQMDSSSKDRDRPPNRKVTTKTLRGHKTSIYEILSIDMTTKIRTEHLSARTQTTERGLSLPQPKARNVSWNEYINAPKGHFPCLGREIIETVNTNRVSIVIGLTEEISIDWRHILDSVQCILNNKLVTFLSQVTTQLPKGFPVVIDFPIKASLYCKWKLISLDMSSDIRDSIFKVPGFYEERTIFTLERSTP